MNGRVAVGAIRGRVEPGMERWRILMARETELGRCLVAQHVSVDRAMGVVTGDTAFDPDRAVLVDVGTLLVGVALEAGLLVESSQSAPRRGFVVLVAIDTLDHALGDPVSFVQENLRLDVTVAS